MEDGFAGVVKATSGWIYVIEYFIALEIKKVRENLKKRLVADLKGFPFLFKWLQYAV